MRRANGSGTIKKLSGNRHKPWAALRAAWYDSDGNCHQELVGTFATKKDAELALAADYLAPHSEYEKFTLEQIFKKWAKTRAYTQLTKSTQQCYSAAFQYYMDDYHSKPFKTLRRDDFQAMIDKADDMGKSASTMTKIRALQSILSEYAMSLDVIAHSYATKLIVPKREKTEIQVFSPDEISKLSDAAALGNKMAQSIIVLIYTGMRISEMLNLKMADLDLNQNIIKGGCKTDAGRNRIIPIHPKIMPIIESRAGQEYFIEGVKGRQIRAEYYRENYYKCLEKLGIRRLTPHKARHTFFTMLDANCSDKLAMALVGGHSDPNFTEQVYVHPDLDRLRAAIATLD